MPSRAWLWVVPPLAALDLEHVEVGALGETSHRHRLAAAAAVSEEEVARASADAGLQATRHGHKAACDDTAYMKAKYELAEVLTAKGAYSWRKYVEDPKQWVMGWYKAAATLAACEKEQPGAEEKAKSYVLPGPEAIEKWLYPMQVVDSADLPQGAEPGRPLAMQLVEYPGRATGEDPDKNEDWSPWTGACCKRPFSFKVPNKFPDGAGPDVGDEGTLLFCPRNGFVGAFQLHGPPPQVVMRAEKRVSNPRDAIEPGFDDVVPAADAAAAPACDNGKGSCMVEQKPPALQCPGRPAGETREPSGCAAGLVCCDAMPVVDYYSSDTSHVLMEPLSFVSHIKGKMKHKYSATPEKMEEFDFVTDCSISKMPEAVGLVYVYGQGTAGFPSVARSRLVLDEDQNVAHHGAEKVKDDTLAPLKVVFQCVGSEAAEVPMRVDDCGEYSVTVLTGPKMDSQDPADAKVTLTLKSNSDDGKESGKVDKVVFGTASGADKPKSSAPGVLAAAALFFI